MSEETPQNSASFTTQVEKVEQSPPMLTIGVSETWVKEEIEKAKKEVKQDADKIDEF